MVGIQPGNPDRKHWFRDLLIVAVSGACIPLGFAPFGLWGLTVLGIAGLFLAICNAQSPRVAMLYGFVFGLLKFGVGVSWIYMSIRDYGYAPVWLATFLVVLFVVGLSFVPAIFAWVVRRTFNFATAQGDASLSYAFRVLCFALAWLGYEVVFHFLLTGFPWLILGTVLIDTPMNVLAPVLSSLGLSLWVVLAGCLCACALLHRRTLLFVPVLLTPFAFYAFSWTEPGQSARVALVQPNIPLEEKWNPGTATRHIERTLDLTRAAQPTDIVVWSEALVSHLSASLQESLTDMVDRSQGSIVLGLFEFGNENTPPKIYQSVALLDRDEVNFYRKERLVPFGEYVPFASALRGLIRFFDLPRSDISPGPPNQSGFQVAGTNTAIAICYEIAYGFAVHDAVRRNAAQVLITVSEDSWFGDSIGPHQHLQIARMRALETGLYTLRGTNSGITAIIGPDGEVNSQLPQFTSGVLEGSIVAMQGRTPVVAMPWLPFFVLPGVLVCLLGLTVFVVKRQNA